MINWKYCNICTPIEVDHTPASTEELTTLLLLCIDHTHDLPFEINHFPGVMACKCLYRCSARCSASPNHEPQREFRQTPCHTPNRSQTNKCRAVDQTLTTNNTAIQSATLFGRIWFWPSTGEDRPIIHQILRSRQRTRQCWGGIVISSPQHTMFFCFFFMHTCCT